MPTYDYHCNSCGHDCEYFQSIMDKPIKKCPSCGKRTLKRQIGAGAALIFRGSGFYATDYRSESYKSEAQKEKDHANAPKGDDSKKKKSSDGSKSKAGPSTDKMKAAG